MRKIIQFVKESWVEFKKVKWPTKQELWGLTVAVITASIILAVYVGIVDWIFRNLIYLVMP